MTTSSVTFEGSYTANFGMTLGAVVVTITPDGGSPRRSLRAAAVSSHRQSSPARASRLQSRSTVSTDRR